ncbi:MAG: PAS domain-containing protein [Armatimonadetes bacterium]|nr:PAS domain-containing protein [Armatimonadota bacterium]
MSIERGRQPQPGMFTRSLVKSKRIDITLKRRYTASDMNDATVKEFIQTVVDTQIKKDLVVFLYQNPCMDDCRGLAVWVNQGPEAIAGEIDHLVVAGILRKDGEGATAIYSYDPKPEVAEVVRDFVQFYKQERDAVQTELSKLREQVDRLRHESLREIQREQSRTKTIIASMADGVIVTDYQDTVVLYNPAAASLLGWDDRSALGRPLQDSIKVDSLTPLVSKLHEIKEQPYTLVSTELVLNDPRSLTVKANLSPVHDADGERIGAVTVLRDVTEFKELDRAKNDFISMISHELRSPLTSIKGFLLSLMRGLFGEVSQKQMEPLQIIRDQSDRLLNLINDLLEISRGEMKLTEQKLEPTDLGALLRRCVDLVQGQASDKQIEIHQEIPESLPAIDADCENMEKVFSNLLSNAVKYTPPEGEVFVVVRDLGMHLQVSVADTGFGIPEESLPRVFEKFYRVKNEKTREIMGTGLGLSIVKNIVDDHNGTVEVTSPYISNPEGKSSGTAFTVTLPRRQAVAQQ